jgi:hypothetical protein
MRSVLIISSDKGLQQRPCAPLNEWREQPLSTLFGNTTLREANCVRMMAHSNTILSGYFARLCPNGALGSSSSLSQRIWGLPRPSWPWLATGEMPAPTGWGPVPPAATEAEVLPQRSFLS